VDPAWPANCHRVPAAVRDSGGVRASDGNPETLWQVLDGFNEHDLDAFMAHFADDHFDR